MGKKNKTRKKDASAFERLLADVHLPSQSNTQKAPPAPSIPKADRNNDSDTHAFANAMQGVVPISKSDTIAPPVHRAVATTTHGAHTTPMASGDHLPKSKPSFIFDEHLGDGTMVCGRAAGVSKKVLTSLQNGDLSHHPCLDLHGFTQQEARTRLHKFIQQMRKTGHRRILVVTGRGLGSPGGISILKQSLPHWLMDAPCGVHVLAFCTARRTDGGPGAFYVLLRKRVEPTGNA